MAGDQDRLRFYPELLTALPSEQMTWLNLGLLDEDAVPSADDSMGGPWRRSLNLARQTLAGIQISGARFLDVGCGRGGLCAYAARQNAARVVGLDIVPEHVAWCTKNHAGIEFVLGNGSELPFGPDEFDIITCIESASHYLDLRAFFAGAFRSLAPGGVLAVATIATRTIAETSRIVTDIGFQFGRADDITVPVVRSIDAWDEVSDEMVRLGCDAALVAQIANEVTSNTRQLLTEAGYRYLAWQAVKPMNGDRVDTEAGR